MAAHVIRKIKSPYEPCHSRFRIHFEQRTPKLGPCPMRAEDGVGRLQLILRYAAALQDAYEYFRDRRWKEPDFGGDLTRRIDVRVQIDDGPGLGLERTASDSLPRIYLHSELMETYPPAVLFDRARAEATHEVTHIFTEVYQRKKDPDTERGWHWFNEATAAYFERKLNPSNVATLNYQHTFNWVNYPRMSPEIHLGFHPKTNEPWFSYSPWLLMALVDQTGDEDLIRRAWDEAREKQLPREILRSLLKEKGMTLADAMHRYAVGSFRTRWLDELAFSRYGNRKLEYVAEVDAGAPPTAWRCKVGPLACRYYRIRPTRRVSALRVEVRPAEAPALRHLNATMHGTRHPYDATPLAKPLAPVDGVLVFEGPIGGFPGGCLALVVSCAAECKLDELGFYSHVEHGYEVKVRAF